MKLYVFAAVLMFLAACSAKESKPYKLFCITALGTVQIASDDPNLKIYSDTFVQITTTDGSVATFNKSMCVEIHE